MTLANFVRQILQRVLGVETMRGLAAYRQARRQARDETQEDARRTTLYGRWVQPGDLVFDIGANLGNRTRVFAGLGARVIAVEPQSHCQRALRWLFLGQRRVRIIAAAAGRDHTPQRMVQFDTDVLSSMNPAWIAAARESGRFGELKTVREVMVPCVTLDELIARHGRPVFTKIDVEGYEAEVLAGLSQTTGTVSFEITPEMSATTENCLLRLTALGYRQFQFSPGETMALDGPWLEAAALRAVLHAFTVSRDGFGDIYALDPQLAG